MNFFKTFLASLLAFIVANILIGIFYMMIFIGIAVASISEKPTGISNNSVLMIDYEIPIVDAPDDTYFTMGFSGLNFENKMTILDAVTAIDNAVYDDKIEGIYLNLSAISTRTGSLEELRNALIDFKKESGKFIICYSDHYSTANYYLGSVADLVFLNPMGNFEWNGLSTTMMFFKGTMDKLDLNVEIFRHGAFKSAVESYSRTDMSTENRLQYSEVNNSYWNTILDGITESRGVSRTLLDSLAGDFSIRTPQDAEKYGLVDALLYKDQLREFMNHITKGDMTLGQALGAVTNAGGSLEDNEGQAFVSRETKDKGPKYITLNNYSTHLKANYRSKSKNKVAIVYVKGSIVYGDGNEGSANSDDIARKLRKARRDDNTKAVVVRVDSPGGSVIASDIISREIELIQREKPVIISMGSTAASGGYWISAPADAILADKMTLTGSIGVFGMFVQVDNMLKNKLGITTDVVKTHPYADFMYPFRPMMGKEKEYLQEHIDDIYDKFVDLVAEGRNMSREQVDAVAGGRVWTGRQALDIGLIDGYGGLKEALALAADRAGISGNYKVWEVVNTPDNFTMILKMLMSSTDIKVNIDSKLVEQIIQNEVLLKSIEEDPIQARVPFETDITESTNQGWNRTNLRKNYMK